MIRGAILHLDVAQLVLYAFFAFFAGLIWYLRKEDRREGYPLESEALGGVKERGWLFLPEPKTFRLADGSVVQAPTYLPDSRPINAVKVEPWPGAPFDPVGDPLLAGVGAGAWAVRRISTCAPTEFVRGPSSCAPGRRWCSPPSGWTMTHAGACSPPAS